MCNIVITEVDGSKEDAGKKIKEFIGSNQNALNLTVLVFNTSKEEAKRLFLSLRSSYTFSLHSFDGGFKAELQKKR